MFYEPVKIFRENTEASVGVGDNEERNVSSFGWISD